MPASRFYRNLKRNATPWLIVVPVVLIFPVLVGTTAGCGSGEPIVVSYSVAEKEARESCEIAQPEQDLYDQLIQTNEQQQLLDSLTRKLDRLKGFVQRYVRSGSEMPIRANPSWVSGQFTATGLNWNGFSKRFHDNATTVDRWQTSKQAPQFNGENAFGKFVDDSFAVWGKSKGFLLDLKPYSTNWLEDQLETRLVAEIYGQTSDGLGQQATAIWVTRWQVDSVHKELTLVSAKILAQEQVTLQVPEGRLFHDCTESILAPTDLLKRQLSYGLDQWAARVPGLDVVGDQGIAVGDIDGDGLDDLYVCQAHGLPNLLLIQNPDGSVSDAGQKHGVDLLDQSRGALMVDLDNDGDQDLAITTDKSLVLMSQKRDGKFQLEHEISIGQDGHSLSAADYDQDGDLDLFVCKHRSIKSIPDLITIPESHADASTGGRNVLLRNDEGWSFRDVTNQVGFTPESNQRYSRSAVWTDYDLDGDLDLYVANEWAADQLFRNDEGWFSEVGDRLGMTSPAQHRSVSAGEFNLDGKPDLFVATDSPLAAWQRISGDAQGGEKGPAQDADRKSILGENQIWFSKTVSGGTQGDTQGDTRGTQAGFDSFFLRAPIFSAESAFGSVAADINNDGLDDVIVTNGHLSRYSSDDIGGLFYSNLFTGASRDNSVTGVVSVRPIEYDMLGLIRSGTSAFGQQRNRCYLSIGKLGFANFSGVSGVDFLDDARAVATTDWDHDGDVDVIMTSRNGPQLRILSNENRKQNGYLHFKLRGTTSNRDAIGARVELFLNGRDAPLVKFVSAGSGNLSQSSKRLFFGLGNKTRIEKAVVTWPDGKQQTFDRLVPNTRYVITEGQEKLAETNNVRFKLVQKRSDLQGEIKRPPISMARFRPLSWLPNIEYLANNQKWYAVSPVNDAFTTIVICDASPESKKVLDDLVAGASAWRGKKLDVVILFIDREADSDEARLISARRFLPTDVPFRWGALSLSSIQKLEYYCGHWFSNQQLPHLPFALSMTNYGQIASCHFPEGTAGDDSGQTDSSIQSLAKKLAGDLAALVEDSGNTGLNDRGIWINRYRTEDFSRLVVQFREKGMERTADEMFFRSRPHMALQLTQYAAELTAQGDLQQAMRFYQRAIKLYPENVPALVGRGNLIRQQALGMVDDELSVKLQTLDQAAESFAAALALDPFSTEAIIGKSNIMIDKSETSAAIVELAAYLEVDPGRAEIHAILGRLHFSKRDFNSAARHLLAAYELRPTLPYVAGDLGYLYLSSGQPKLGRKFLRLSNRLQPSDRNVIKHLAEAEFATGNFTEAVNLLTRTVKLHPNHRRSKQLLAWLLATSPFEEDRDGGQGQKLIKPLVMMMGDRSPTTLEVYAACFAETGDFDQAVRHQEKAIALIRAEKSEDRYSEDQKNGMVARLELYNRKRPYRTADLMQIPIETTTKVK